MAVLRGPHDRVERLVRSTIGQSVKGLDAPVNQGGTQLLGLLHTRLINAYAGSQLVFPYALTHLSGAGLISVELERPAPPTGEGRDTTTTNLSTPVPPKPSTSRAKESRGRYKKACG